jgi:microcystin-dependent protein
MTLETATHISGLNQLEPEIGRDIVDGAGHLRLLKSVLKNTFPNQNVAHRAIIEKTVNFSPVLGENTAHFMIRNGRLLTLPPVGGFPATQYYTVQPKGASATILGIINGRNQSVILWPGAVYEIYIYAGSWRVDIMTECVGDIKICAKEGFHLGWAEASGAAYSRTEFEDLFAAIGTTYGAGNGSTTFNIPNLNGLFVLGNSGVFPMGSTGGSRDAIVPAHTHAVTNPNHSHGVVGSRAIFVKDGTDKAISEPFGLTNTGGAGAGVSIASAGESVTNKNLPPYMALCYKIKIL